jgi:hypothetical protein
MIIEIASVAKIKADVVDVRNTYTIDMRNVVLASYHKDFIVPWCSQVSYSLSEIGILTVHADWTDIVTPTTGKEATAKDTCCTNSLALIPVVGHSDIQEDLTLNKKLGTVSFDGRDYFLFLADHRIEKHYVMVLTPLWRGGKFAFEQTVMLPDIDLHIGSYVAPVIRGQDDISTINFAVYLSYTPAQNTMSTKVVVELNELGDFETRLIVEGDVEITLTVRAMSIADLKLGLDNHIGLNDEDDEDYADE